MLIVLLLLSITLGLSYAMVRSQTTALQIQQNANVRTSARRAALTGLTVALKEMHTSEWCYGDGVNTTLSGPIGDHESYQVTYAAGDPSLAVDDADSPYRVTLLSTGTATDPTDPERTSTHQARAVVHLAPRSVADEPTDWATMQQYTVYQSQYTGPAGSFRIDIPCRLEGPVRVQDKVKIAPSYPDDTDPAWKRYLGDLNAMRLNGYPDYRPFQGPVDLPFSEQSAENLSVLTIELAVTANDTPIQDAAADWTKPSSLTSYQIYAGGPIYTIPTAAGILENTTLEPDPLTNPLGIYYRDTNIAVKDNVTIRGSLFCRDNIRIEGPNVHFEPVELPGLHGSANPVRLPAATCADFIVRDIAGGTVTGLLAVFNEFQIEPSPDTVEFSVTGRVITREFFIRERQPWEIVDWVACREDFEAQLGGEPPVVEYFPEWMANWDPGYDPKPLITFKPDPSPITYHWKNPNDPIYVPHPDDDGLRWDLLEWTDSL